MKFFHSPDAVIAARVTDQGVLTLEFTYGGTEGAVGSADGLQPVLSDDVTVYVSDGEQIYCLTEAGD